MLHISKILITDEYLGLCQTYDGVFLAKIINTLQPLIIFTKNSNIDIWQGLNPLSANRTKW